MWLTEDEMEKFRRFRRMAADPKLRACPQCNRLCSPSTREDGTVVQDMRCEDCDLHFCAYHSNAHARGPEACAAYEREVVKKEKTDLKNLGTKPCPTCGLATEKDSGCNHMTCRCGANWCWICGHTLDNVGWHYNPANPRGCMQYQSDQLRSKHDQRLLIACKVLAFPAVLVSTLLMVMFVIVCIATLCIPAFFCCKEIGFKVWVGFAGVLVSIPFVLFSFAWAVIALAEWILLLPFCADCIHLQFLVGVPYMTMLALSETIISPGAGSEHS